MTEDNQTETVEEKAIFQLVENGNKEDAKQALFDLIVAAARKKDFSNAERLRERMYEIDPMAIIEIVRSGEIIEQEKGNAIGKDDRAIWDELSNMLSSGEFQTMYHELNELTFGPDEIIVSQGDKSDSLYFVNRGSVLVSHRVKDKDLLIATLERGEIIGENFFKPSFWTVSLSSQTQTELYELKQETIEKWHGQYPDLKTKLEAYYENKSTVSEMIKQKGIDRRQFKRFVLSGKVQIKPLNRDGEAFGRGFRSQLVDVSAGGLSFLIRITKSEDAKLLLGKALQITVPVGDGKKGLRQKGISTGIQLHDAFDNDYSVHVQFNSPLSEEMLKLLMD